jgi:hypothetical protein
MKLNQEQKKEVKWILIKTLGKIENWSREIKADEEKITLWRKEIEDDKYWIWQMDICIDYLFFFYSYLDAVW